MNGLIRLHLSSIAYCQSVDPVPSTLLEDCKENQKG